MRQIVKSLLLKLSSYIYRNNDSKVIFYHDVHTDGRYTSMSTPMELFINHIEMISKEGYTVVPEITEPEKQILITFDDGFKGLYKNFDYFVEKQIPVKIFLIVDYLNNPNYLAEEEVKELLKTGLVTIGSHTLSHRNLDTLSSCEITEELAGSKQKLEEMFDVVIDEVCYPRGRFNTMVMDTSKTVGYGIQYSCLPGSYHEQFLEGVVRRNFVQHVDVNDFRSYLKGAGEIFYGRYLKQHFRDGHAS